MMGHKIMASILATKASGFWQVFAAIHTHIISEMEQKLEYSRDIWLDQELFL